MKKIKKYAYGTSVKNYIENPGTELQQQQINNAKALYEANSNPLTMGLQGVGNILMQQGLAGGGVSSGEHSGSIGGKDINFNVGSGLASGLNNLLPMAGNLNFAFGGQVPGVPVEVEGGEVAQTPGGEMMEFQGPSHEQGGVPANLPEDTEVYSKRIKIDGKTMAQRKKFREKKKEKLQKILDKNSSDAVVKNTMKRTEDILALEEAKDEKIQNSINQIMQGGGQPATGTPQQEMAYGGPVGGGPGFDPESLMNFINEALKANQSPGQMAQNNPGFNYGASGMNNTVGMYQSGNNKDLDGDGVDDDLLPNPTPATSQKTNTPIGNTPKNPNVSSSNSSKSSSKTITTEPINVGDPVINHTQTVESGPKGFDPNFVTPSNVNQDIDPNSIIDNGPGATKQPIQDLNTFSKSLADGTNLAGGFNPNVGINLKNNPQTTSTTTVNKTNAADGSSNPNNLTFGDALGLSGQIYSSFAPYLNTLQNRSQDKPNINPYLEYGKKGLEKLDDTKRYVAQQRDENLQDLELARRSAIRRGRNSARSINTLRGLDLATDQSINNQQSNIYNQFAQQMSGIMGAEAQALDRRDQMVMQGEAARDLADRQDTDNYYTQRRVDKENIGFGTQNIGKSLNQIHKRGQNQDMIDQMTALGLDQTAINQIMSQYMKAQAQLNNQTISTTDKSTQG